MKILMVCLGNICRSPLAMAILTSKLKEKNINAVVDSAGTANYHIGEPADKRTIDVAGNHGIDLTAHRARQFTFGDFSAYDMIYVMDKDNYRNVINKAGSENDKQKVKFLLDVMFPGRQAAVPDPWYGEMEDFEEVFQLLDAACARIADEFTRASA